jgi:hypothetical protein
MCRVLNKREVGVPVGAVYIGRSSKWGNPFRIGPDGDRATVIAKHERWLADQHHLLRGPAAPARQCQPRRADRVVARRQARGLRGRGRPGRV